MTLCSLFKALFAVHHGYCHFQYDLESTIVLVEDWKQGYSLLTCGGELEGERRLCFEVSAVSVDSASAEGTPLLE